MGSRLLEDDDEQHDPDDPDAPAVLPRKPKESLLMKMAGEIPTASVGSSLDSFITKANEGLLDLKENPPSRERDLEAKVDELEKKLAEAEARAKKAEATRAVAAEPVMPVAPQSRGWGGIAVAFVLGCGAMFAVSTFVLSTDTEKTASAPAATPEIAPAPSPTPAPPPSVAPIEQPDVATPTPTPPPPAVETKTVTETETETETKAEAKVAAKKLPKHTPKRTETPSTTKPPEPAHTGSDELYNPF